MVIHTEKTMIKLQEYEINPALIVIDMQNRFVSKGHMAYYGMDIRKDLP
jgi:hypothetical protein